MTQNEIEVITQRNHEFIKTGFAWGIIVSVFGFVVGGMAAILIW